jgi:hypothetical protein
MDDNLSPSSADVTESGSLNLPEPSGPHRPVMGLLYLFIFYFKNTRREENGKTAHMPVSKLTLCVPYIIICFQFFINEVISLKTQLLHQ